MPLIRNQQTVVVNAGDCLLIGGNLKRKALIIGTPKTSTVWLSFVGPGQSGTGIPLRPGQAALVLASEYISEGLVEEIRASSDGVAEAIGIVELFG